MFNVKRVEQVLGCVVGANPVCHEQDGCLFVKTGLGSCYRIDLTNKIYSLFVSTTEKPVPQLPPVTREVLVSTRRSMFKICLEMAKWELHRSIKRSLKV